ncbi:MAG: DUF4249 domain-containing protein [Chitinophagaceae bacterium]|nr:DUF4249 domain-containing protein [Chitinophagaceae bacterium]MCW5906029.1 DUF4249 domain-containing protein [Chitinophagaceae bacterium]
MKTKKLFYFIIFSALAISCRRNYTPPEVTTDYHILVIEGFINTGADSSFFKLSRTQKLGNATSIKTELGAQLSILSSTGSVLSTSVSKGNGEYAIYSATLTATESYRLKIITSDAKVYQSDLVEVKQTPAIDSVTWKIDNEKNGIQFFVNTHDATKKSLYYKWDCEEVWEYRAYFESQYKYLGDSTIEFRTPDEQVYRCWSSEKSAEIFINSTERLGEDIVSNEKILFVKKGGNRFNQRYSLLVKQYALTKESYEYWQQLKQMTELGGSVFDVQPTQLIGNIQCISNPDEPIIGYISAATASEKRIFINRDEVPSFVMSYPIDCDMKTVAPNIDSMSLYYNIRKYLPIAPDVLGAYLASTLECADCRFYGGTTTKPSFW